jgi:hypothetical protein
MCLRPLVWVKRSLGGWQREYQPTAPYIHVWKLQNIAEDQAICLRVCGVDDDVCAIEHSGSPNSDTWKSIDGMGHRIANPLEHNNFRLGSSSAGTREPQGPPRHVGRPHDSRPGRCDGSAGSLCAINACEQSQQNRRALGFSVGGCQSLTAFRCRAAVRCLGERPGPYPLAVRCGLFSLRTVQAELRTCH